jgi:hypothetical protein
MTGPLNQNVVTDVELDIEIVGGLSPLDLHLGAAVAKTVRAHKGGCGWRGVVIGIGRLSCNRDRIAEGRPVVSLIASLNRNAVRGGRRARERRIVEVISLPVVARRLPFAQIS